ncbi:MAG TPA: hypothetical protein DGD08_15285 [Gemmatimonas aurantiaca]|uniref:YncE family protein n=2 Tax=Gemmatimonas aurantiaca TaxID=173480 RepID=C1A5M5_GEMAT|nr:hypothetical protein [Gemmatimonas aurantiaca]BAH37535.1 hypothetical protein GAU_0493 [Gemmatimonas aurantiaca T-27]HCT58567.1 hypothetical protein [Gemmatimonas aurantiaca]
MRLLTVRHLLSSRRVAAMALLALTAACGEDGPSEPTPAPGFLGGVAGNREIGVVINSGTKSITMFQLGSPTTTVQIPLGSSTTVTPIGFSLRGRRAAVPLGNAASVALVNLETATVGRFFTFPSGNATGSVWANDTTVFAANTNTNKIGRFYVNQTATEITSTVDVAPAPTAMAYSAGRVLAISGNLANFVPIGEGVVTAINPATMAVLGTVQTGGTNPNEATIGPDGLLYVLNTGDYVAQGSMAIIDPATMTRVALIPNMGVGPGHISIDANGLAYISSFSNATLVWNTRTRAFVRGPADPVCAKRASNNACRGASSSAAATTGRLYQLFFGSTSQGLAPYAFVYDATTFALRDSISVGAGPMSLAIRTF